jgi:hypothetical protein
VYPGTDLVYDGSQCRREYTFVVAPSSDLSGIRFHIDGADTVEPAVDGALVVHTAAGDLRQPAPVIYQEIEGSRQTISGGYVLAGGDQVGFALGANDTSRPPVIDPVLVFSTFFGGTQAVRGLTRLTIAKIAARCSQVYRWSTYHWYSPTRPQGITNAQTRG